MASATARGKQWATTAAEELQTPQQIAQLLDFLVGHDGLDFHSDEDFVVDVQENAQQRVQTAAAAQSLAVVAGAADYSDDEEQHPSLHGTRVVLTHSFRSPLAAAMLHALDRNEGPRPSLSTRVGAELSARMANKLRRRTDLCSLYDQGLVEAAATKGKQSSWSDEEEDVRASESEQQVRATHPNSSAAAHAKWSSHACSGICCSCVHLSRSLLSASV